MPETVKTAKIFAPARCGGLRAPPHPPHCQSSPNHVHLRDVLSDLGLLASGPTVIRTDNKSIIELSRDAIAFKKTKHILRAAMFLRDLCLRLIFTLRWISGETNPADLFTKAHPVTVFRALMRVFDRLQHVA